MLHVPNRQGGVGWQGGERLRLRMTVPIFRLPKLCCSHSDLTIQHVSLEMSPIPGSRDSLLGVSILGEGSNFSEVCSRNKLSCGKCNLIHVN